MVETAVRVCWVCLASAGKDIASLQGGRRRLGGDGRIHSAPDVTPPSLPTGFQTQAVPEPELERPAVPCASSQPANLRMKGLHQMCREAIDPVRPSSRCRLRAPTSDRRFLDQYPVNEALPDSIPPSGRTRRSRLPGRPGSAVYFRSERRAHCTRNTASSVRDRRCGHAL